MCINEKIYQCSHETCNATIKRINSCVFINVNKFSVLYIYKIEMREELTKNKYIRLYFKKLYYYN